MDIIKGLTQKQQYILAGLFTLVVIVATIWLLQPGANYPLERNIRYSFTLQNTSNRLQENVEFKVYAPVKQTSNQLSDKITASHDFKLEQDSLGNQILHFSFDKFPPYATRIVSIDAKIFLASEPNRISRSDTTDYLAPEKFIEVNNPGIKQLAGQLNKNDDMDTAKSTLQWVSNNIKYAGYIKEDRGAVYALKSKKGDCTEYSYLYTALARANKLPTRTIGGYVYAEDRVLKPADYHNWAESYIDGKWQVIDPQNNKFLQQQSHFIAMRIISTPEKSKLTNSHRFASSTDYIQIQMN